MLSGNCTEALSIQANVTISCSIAKLIKNGIAPLPFPLPALLKQYWRIKRGERVRGRGQAPFYATLESTQRKQRRRRILSCAPAFERESALDLALAARLAFMLLNLSAPQVAILVVVAGEPAAGTCRA